LDNLSSKRAGRAAARGRFDADAWRFPTVAVRFKLERFTPLSRYRGIVPGRRRRFALELLSRLWKFLAVFGGVWVFAAVGFYHYQGTVTLFESFYWAIVTLSTIGYGDIVPTTTAARSFTILVAASQLFLLGYLISVITTVVGEESQRRLLGTLGTDFTGHVVVLGYGPVGSAAVRELLDEEQKVAVVAEKPEQVANIRPLAKDDRLFVTYGPPADKEILKRVNVDAAHSVIVATGDDAETLIAALNLRALSKTIRIVVSVTRPELKDTLRSAGVTYVASPGDLGGRLCANAAFRPDVANAIEDLSAGAYGADLQEYMLTEKSPISRQTLVEAEAIVRRNSDCLVVGIARADASGEFQTVLNPPVSTTFRPGDAILVLGTNDNIRRFHKWFGEPQGR
jgi:voltage-gated potassium channel